MFQKVKDLLKKWQVQVLVVGGALVVATTFGKCTFEPASVSSSEDATEATQVDGAVNTVEQVNVGEADNTESTTESTTEEQ